MARLGDIGTIITGNTPKTSDKRNYDSNDICFVKPSDISETELTIISHTEYHIAEYARAKSRILPAESILVTCIGIIGKVAINNTECAFNQQINAIIPNIEKCDSKYLAYAIQYARPQLQSIANAPVLPILNKSQFSDLKIKLPRLDEQRKTAAVLDKVTDLIAKRYQQLDKLDLLVKSKFIEMFGDPIANPMKWETSRLADLGSCKNGMNFHAGDSGIELNCLGVGDFKDLAVIDDTSVLPRISLNEEPSEEYLLQDGDIVFVRSNGNKMLVGRCLAVYPQGLKTTFSGFCIRYRLTSGVVNTVYLLHLLKTTSARQKLVGRGANIQNLNQKILGELMIPVPPMKLQNEFDNFVRQADKSKFAIQQSLDKLETLKKSLMQQYFG